MVFRHMKLCLTNFLNSIVLKAYKLFMTLLTVVLFTTTGAQTLAEPEWFECNSIGQDEGLVQLNVKCLAQDDLGYLWVGTEDGLLRYNGYEFKTFLHDPLDSTTISDDHIRGMYFEDGNLWLATNSRGICAFVPRENRFYNFFDKTQNTDFNTSYKILSPINDTLLFSLSNNLFVLDVENGTHSQIELPVSDKECVVNDVVQFYGGVYWLATTSEGILEMNRKGCEITATGLLNANTNNCFYPAGSELFIGTEEGLFAYDIAIKKLKATTFTEPVNCFFRESKSSFLLGTDVGLYRFNLDKFCLTPLLVKTQKEVVHAQLDINQIIGDNKGNIWIGTEGDGLFHFNKYQKKFQAVRLELEEFPKTSNISTFQFLPDEDSILWLGTKYGMVKYDQETGNFRFYDSKEKPLIYTLKKDSENTIWAGGFTSGLVRYNSTKDRFEKVEVGLPDKDVIEIIPVNEDELWICTWAGGIHSYQIKSGKTKEVLLNGERINRARTSLIDNDGNIWLGTDQGAYRFKKSGEIEHFSESADNKRKLSGDRIFSIAEDQNGIIWLGTNLGLTKLDPDSLHTVCYYKQKGLPNDFIYSVLIAPNNDVWVSTNFGLSVLRQESNSFTNFTVSDGLQNNEFNGKAGFQDGNGNFYFGGISGFNMFKPEQIMENPHHAPVYIESIELFNTALNKNELFMDEIAFKSSENVLSFNFAALNYLDPLKCNYTYMMEGFDPYWRPVTTDRRTTYTNLDPGTYTLKVRATNDAGVWSPNTDQLKITIIPPWYASNWFRLLFIVVFLLSGLSYYFYQTRKLKNEKTLLESIVYERTREVNKKNEQLQKAYLEASAQRDNVRFLMKEMRHRVNNNLQIISSLLSIQGNRVQSSEAVDVLEMARNRILAIAQVENKIKSDSEKVEIGSFIREISENIIHALSGANNLKFRSTYEIEHFEVERINTTLIGLILNELITNTTKHAFEESSPKNELQISCTLKNDTLTLTVADNGKGFDPARIGNDSMGMSLVEGMVQQLAGKLSVEGRQGTVVKIEVPVNTCET